MILAFIFLSLAIACRSCVELWNHGKLKWSKEDDSFWGEHSYTRKYANPFEPPKENWYYRVFKIGYLERFPLSATVLVFLTDGYHLAQFMFFNFLSLSFAFALGFSWITLGLVWGGVHIIHTLLYKFLQK